MICINLHIYRLDSIYSNHSTTQENSKTYLLDNILPFVQELKVAYIALPPPINNQPVGKVGLRENNQLKSPNELLCLKMNLWCYFNTLNTKLTLENNICSITTECSVEMGGTGDPPSRNMIVWLDEILKRVEF